MTSVNTSVFRVGHVEFVCVLAHGGVKGRLATDVDHSGTPADDVLRHCLRRLKERVRFSIFKPLQVT